MIVDFTNQLISSCECVDCEKSEIDSVVSTDGNI